MDDEDAGDVDDEGDGHGDSNNDSVIISLMIINNDWSFYMIDLICILGNWCLILLAAGANKLKFCKSPTKLATIKSEDSEI